MLKDSSIATRSQIAENATVPTPIQPIAGSMPKSIRKLSAAAICVARASARCAMQNLPRYTHSEMRRGIAA